MSAFAAALNLSVSGHPGDLGEVATSPQTERLPAVEDSKAATRRRRYQPPSPKPRASWEASSTGLHLHPDGFGPQPACSSFFLEPVSSCSFPGEFVAAPTPPTPPAMPAQPVPVPASLGSSAIPPTSVTAAEPHVAGVSAAEKPTAGQRPGNQAAHPRHNKAKGPARQKDTSGPATSPSSRPKVERKLIEDL